MPHRSLVSGALLILMLSACGGDGGGGARPVSSDASASTPPAVSLAWQGHFVGTVSTANETLFGDGFLTADGSMRLYVGGPYDPTGALQMTRPAASQQFVGTFKVSADHSGATGTGTVIGQQCSAGAHVPFCDEPAVAQATMSISPGGCPPAPDCSDIDGELQVTTASGTETWVLDLTRWIDDGQPAGFSGQFQELLAEFATGDDTQTVLDASGAISFQSAGSGCAGNGMLTPRTDGSPDAADVALTIGNCSGALAYLNGEYAGLATFTPSSYWDYDGLLRVWISKSPGSATPEAAVTMLAE
jgi:hypothetical protein